MRTKKKSLHKPKLPHRIERTEYRVYNGVIEYYKEVSLVDYKGKIIRTWFEFPKNTLDRWEKKHLELPELPEKIPEKKKSGIFKYLWRLGENRNP